MLDAGPCGPAESELRESRKCYHAGADAPAGYSSLAALPLSAGTLVASTAGEGSGAAAFALSSAGLALSLGSLTVATFVLPRGAGTDASRNFRVLRRAAEAHLEMQVRAGRAAGRAHFTDLASARHDVALLHEQLRAMRVASDEVVAVIDVDHVAVLRMEAGEDDDAAGGGNDLRAGFGEEIDSFVHRQLAGERIDPLAEAGGVVGRPHRKHRRHELFLHRLLEELRLQHPKRVVLVFELAR